MKNILLLLSSGFEPFEASAFIDVFGWNALEGDKSTKLVSCSLIKNIQSSFGLNVITDLTCDQVKVEQFDALAVPGGFEEFGFYVDAFDERFLKIIRDFNSAGKPIASVCTGSIALAKAGILTDRNATTYNTNTKKRRIQLESKGAKFINKDIVTDENVITSCGPSTAINVAFSLLEILTSKQNTENVKKLMGFNCDGKI